MDNNLQNFYNKIQIHFTHYQSKSQNYELFWCYHKVK